MLFADNKVSRSLGGLYPWTLTRVYSLDPTRTIRRALCPTVFRGRDHFVLPQLQGLSVPHVGVSLRWNAMPPSAPTSKSLATPLSWRYLWGEKRKKKKEKRENREEEEGMERGQWSLPWRSWRGMEREVKPRKANKVWIQRRSLDPMRIAQSALLRKTFLIHIYHM